MAMNWRDWVSTWLPEERVSVFNELLEQILAVTPDPDNALTRLVQLAEMSGNPRWLLGYLLDDPATFEGLMVLLGGSNFAAQTLLLHPEYLELFADRERLAKTKGLGQFLQEIKSALSPFRSVAAKWGALRRFRRREMVRLIAADLLGLMDLATLTAELSDLAEAILKAGLELVRGAEREVQETISPEGGCQVLVVAFGKLGARELNYSSDVDLVIFHEGETFTAERLVRKFVSALTEVSDYGRLYRVDLRLRPYGATGPLTLPLDAALAYYETQAEPSDKLALLKARAIAGDKNLAVRFEEFRKAFVFGNPIEPEEFAWLLRLKTRSEETFATEGAVKHGLGGIRDVEMTVQFLQLAFAHRFPDLAVRDTLTALQKLRDRNLLTEQEFAALRDGYLFLRRLEHMLQIAEDLPLQTLPKDERELNRLARCMGLESGEALLRAFEWHTKQVRQVYEGVTNELAKTLGVSEQVMLSLSVVGGLETDENAFLSLNFARPREAQKRLFRLIHGEATVGLRWREQIRVMKVLPSLLDAVARTPDPDSALMRLEGIVDALGPRHSVLDSLASNLFALRALTLVASISEPLCQLATRHPEWLEALLSGVLPEIPDEETIRREVSSSTRDKGWGTRDERKEWDAFARTVRWLKGKFALPLGFASLCRLSPSEAVERVLSKLADILVGESMRWLKKPTGFKIAVFALGGWGSEELHFGSDLDVAFAHEGEYPAAERFVRELRSLLGDLTEDGFAYRLDLRLRPAGQEGSLSSDLEAWREFAEQRFEFWMALAWTRLRFAAGEPNLGRTVVNLVRKRLYEQGLTAEQWEELKALMTRIRAEHLPPEGVIDLKHSDGALWDIDLLVAEKQLKMGQRTRDEGRVLIGHETLRSSSVRAVLRELAKSDRVWGHRLAAYERLRQWRLWLSWISPDRPPRFVKGDHTEQLLAWLDANPEPLTQEKLKPVDEAVEQWREKWRTVTSVATMPEGGDEG
jgi:glutamate-ammonia-ligase adenylyltransferase